MSDADDRIIALLEQLVELHKAANQRQEQAWAASERHFAEARARSEQAIALQTTAVARQRLAVRVWFGALAAVLVVVVVLLWILSRYLH